MSMLEILNHYTNRKFTEEDVYIFPITLCNNEVDRDNEHFSVRALEEMKPMFLGVVGYINDKHTAKIFHTKIITKDYKISTGENFTELKAYAYFVRSNDNASIINQIENGEKKEVSISCSVENQTCSICGKDRCKYSCRHVKGRMYDNELCYITLENISDVYEWAFVKLPDNTPKFNLGKVVQTQKISEARKETQFNKEIEWCLERYCQADFDGMTKEDIEFNNLAISHKYGRIIGIYDTGLGKVYIITESDRSRTTITFADEY